MATFRLLSVILTHMTIRDAIQLAEASRPPDGVIRCLIYVRISMDKAHDGHGVANQLAKLEKKANERGWTVVYRLSDNDIGVTRKDPTRPGKYRPGYEEAMRLVDARTVDAVLCFKWDRFIREPLDLEYLIPRFDKAGVRFAEVDGNIDLGTDSGRLHARILIAVAKAEQERKAERQKLANEAAAVNGQRFTGGPRPFGYREDHVTAHPVEGPAVAEACAALLGGGTVSGVMREWTGLGLAPPQKDRRGTARWNRASIRSILLNPRIAGPVGLSRGDRGSGSVGAAGERGDVAGGARRPGGPGPQAAAGGADAAGRDRAVPVRQRGGRRPVAHRESGLPLLDAHPGPVPAGRARGPQGR